MRMVRSINFYLTRDIYKELLNNYTWAKRIVYKKQKPVYVSLVLNLLYHKAAINHPSTLYRCTTPTPNGLDPILTEEQVMLLIQSSSLIGLPELHYLAASLHQENIQNKL